MTELPQKRMHPQPTVTTQHHWLTLPVRRLLLEVGTILTTELKSSTLKITNGRKLLTTHIIKCKCPMTHNSCIIILLKDPPVLDSFNRRWCPNHGWSQR